MFIMIMNENFITLDCNPQQCLLLCPIQTQTFCQQDDVSSFSFLFHQGTAPVTMHINLNFGCIQLRSRALKQMISAF